MVLPPSVEAITGELERLDGLRLVAQDQLRVAESAAVGLKRWLEQTQRQLARRSIDEQSGGEGPTAWARHAAKLEVKVKERERELRQAERASKAVRSMKEGAGRRRAEMREALTKRLTPFLGPLLRALLVNQEIAKTTLELGESRKKTTVGAVVAQRTPLLAMASEGQVAGVNLAIQLAMAQAFPWSRWRGLLLDDPSQFSDVVHSTNLIETLRALARRRRFQIVLSTHDRDFAKYVCAKFRNEGLVATRIAFRESRDGKAGIVPRVVA